MTNRHVHIFPDWDLSPYIAQLTEQLGAEGWDVDTSDRAGFVKALRDRDRVVHIHWTEGFTPNRSKRDALFAWACLLLIRRAARRQGVVWTIHNIEPHEGFAPFVGLRFHRRLARSVSALIVHRESTRKAVAAGFGRGCTIHVTPQASFDSIHGPPRDRDEARRVLRIKPDTTVFAQLGQLRAYKLPVETITAFREAALPCAELIVSGRCSDDRLVANIKSAAAGAENVRVELEFLTDEALLSRIAASNWLVTPYRAIDNPTALELAVAYNRPVIAPDLPAVREALGDHARIIYDPNREPVEALGEAIATAAARPRTDAATRRQQPSATWQDQAKATIAVYESVAHGIR